MAVWLSPELIFGLFITELVMRNPTMGIPALEDGLFVNLLTFDVLCSKNAQFGNSRGHAARQGWK